jgi:glycosyltransferase involved in cell wall biosynthesis
MLHPKKILLVSASFYPEISPRSFRASELAKELARQGNIVTVFTHRIEEVHSKFEDEHKIKIRDLGNLKFSGYGKLPANGTASIFNRIYRRGMLQFFEFPEIELMFLVNKALKGEKGFDLLISVAVPYPVHWGVAKAISKNKQLAGIWVADCGDPYMGNKADSFRKFFYFKYIEKWFCKIADYLSVPTEGSIEAYYTEFHKKIRVIPQGFNFDEVKISDAPPDNPVPTFAYAGGFIPGVRDPKKLFEFLCDYKLPYKFVIYTNNPAPVLPYVQLSGNRIEIRNYVPRETLLVNLSKMDFLVNINNGTTVQTPSKLIDYALTKRPILSLDSAMEETAVVEQFLSGDYSNRLELGDLSRYDIKNIALQFINLTKS